MISGSKTFTFLLFLAFFAFPVNSQQETSQISLQGLRSAVKVARDARSIPYISAENEQDLYFMQGYVTASDRLWQLDLLRRVARGETAEIFGKTTLNEDKRWRKFGFARIAEESVRHYPQDVRDALENYAKGVNAYIASLDEKSLPIEFRILQYKPREWTPADSIIIGKIMAEALSSTYNGDLLRQNIINSADPKKFAELSNVVTPYDVILFGKDKTSAAKTANADAFKKDRDPDDALAVADFIETDRLIRENSLSRIGLFAEDLAASNNWVISGKRTADGKPILANDPHLMPSAPGIWYLSHLSTPKMTVAGVTFSGVPGIVLGHNEHIAWGATNVGPDVQDLYLETFNEKGEYKSPSGWKAPVIRKEEIKVRANPLKPETTVETLEVIETGNGPVVAEPNGKRYSLKWTAFDPKSNDFSAFYYLNRAVNWDGFKTALRDYGGAMQNFVYADTKGNIGWYAAGKIPLRRKGDGAVPYDGDTTDGDWIGSIPFDELPHLYNPSEGFIMTANQRIVGTDYKYPQLVRDFAAPWRARRLYDLISNDKKATMDSTTAAQMDVHNIPLKMLAEDIVRLKAADDASLKIISEWDGKMLPDSRGALLVNEIRLCAAEKISASEPVIPAYLIRERILHRAVREGSALWLSKEYKGYDALLRSCSEKVSNTLSERFGTDQTKWIWGNVSVARFPHPLAVAPLIGGQFATPKDAISGSGQTPNVASNVSMRHVSSPGNWDATRFVIPLGQSGDPKSPNYKDQFGNWSSGEPAVFPFSKDAVNKAAVQRIEFKP